MDNFINPTRRPIKRNGAEHNIRLILVSFAASVILTRLSLSLAGYPQLGRGTLHIAHVLWGGLLLFIASVLLLILANRWAYSASAVLSGVGVGLFIDEVGKFITRSNDYFYPAAAPIIYAFFLLTLLLYLDIRRPPQWDARAEMYRALEALQEVLDHDLEAHERADLQARLRRVLHQADQPDLVRLASVLLNFLGSQSLHLAPDRPGFWERWRDRLRTFEARWITQRRLKIILILGLGALGLGALTDLAAFFVVALAPVEARQQIVASLMASGQVTSASSLEWFTARQGLEGAVGLLLLLASAFLLIGQDRRGTRAGQFGLLLALTTVNLLVFYFDQFAAVIVALIQAGLLLGIIRYRRLYLAK